MVGRILRTADFERVLAQQPCSRSAHFAVHHLAGCPTMPAKGRKMTGSGELSTVDAPSHPLLVDESDVQAPSGWWLGTVVPKRHARRAVTRTLLKRQIRAAMAREAAQLPSGLWVVRLKAPFDLRQFPSASSAPLRESARAELTQLLQRAVRRPDGKNGR